MIQPIDLDQLASIERAASPAPWAYTEHCGAQVCIGLVHDQKHGQVRLAKGGFFLFEIDGSAYYPQVTEEQGEKQALADVKLISFMRNYLPSLLTELREARAALSAINQLAPSPLEIPHDAMVPSVLAQEPPPVTQRIGGDDLDEMHLAALQAVYAGFGWISCDSKVLGDLLTELREARAFKARVTAAIERSHQNRHQSDTLSLNTLLEDLTS